MEHSIGLQNSNGDTVLQSIPTRVRMKDFGSEQDISPEQWEIIGYWLMTHPDQWEKVEQ